MVKRQRGDARQVIEVDLQELNPVCAQLLRKKIFDGLGQGQAPGADFDGDFPTACDAEIGIRRIGDELAGSFGQAGIIVGPLEKGARV